MSVNFSIIQKSQLEGAKRIDAEYYQPEYFRYIKTLENLKAQPISDVAINAKRKFIPDNEKLFQYIEISEIDLSTGEYGKKDINGKEAPDRAQWILEKNDIIISTVRPIRNAVSLIRENAGNLVCSSGFAVLKPEKIEPEYLFVYLKTKPIIRLLDRKTTASMYPAIVPEDIMNLKIYIGDEKFRSLIKKLVIQSFMELDNAKSLYSQAEDLLLEELGLKNYKFKDDLFFIVNSSKVKERIDADYFQPKYEELLEQIRKYNPNKLENYISNYSTGYTFKSENYQEEGIPLIRINNIKKGLIDLSNTAYLSEKDFSLSPKDEAKPGDIVLSMSGSIGLTAMIPPEIPKCSVNQRILKFTSKNINKEYLILVLNSIVGSLQFERIGTGGVQTNISYKDIKNIIIPELETNIQQKIAELVIKSHEARKKSKELLNEAKRKVEEIIE